MSGYAPVSAPRNERVTLTPRRVLRRLARGPLALRAHKLPLWVIITLSISPGVAVLLATMERLPSFAP